jgi:hypothetical protein
MAFAFGVPAFVLIYQGLLDGLTLLAVLWVGCVLLGMHVLSLAVEWFTNEYVAADHNEP